jgi:hypothetical protein
MEKRALKKSLCWFIVLVLPLVLILGVVPCAAEATYTLQDLIDNKTAIRVDNLMFSDFFVPPPLVAGDISVNTIGEGTLKPGIEFALNGRFSVSDGSSQTVKILYTVTHLRGEYIKGTNLILTPITISGNAGVIVREDIECKQNGVLRESYYAVRQNVAEQFSAGKFDTPQASLLSTISISASAPSGEASIKSLKQEISLAPMIHAEVVGDDQVVFDQVTLKASETPVGGLCTWQLYDNNGEDYGEALSGEQVTFTGLVNGFYVAKLTVTNEAGEFLAVDFVNIAAAGPAGGGTEPGTPAEAELNLWDFTLKKYRYCKWSTARMVGTFNLPDDVEFHRGDDLVGKVTIQLNRGEDPLVLMSDDIKLKVSNWRYKLEISKH